MMHRHTAVLLSAVITSAVVVPALAQTAIKAPAADTEQVLEMQLKMEEARLLPLRAMYVRYFQQAYRRYPSIPRGTLESLAYVQSRWSPLQPDAKDQDHAHLRMPPSWGVMGLYAGAGFEDQVGEAAKLLGVSSAAVRTDADTNILAAAALLDAQIRQDHPDAAKAGAPAPEAIRAALMRYAGYAPRDAGVTARSAVDDYARTSFAYDVLLAQDRGVNDRGIVVPERAIAWEQAFDAPQLSARTAGKPKPTRWIRSARPCRRAAPVHRRHRRHPHWMQASRAPTMVRQSGVQPRRPTTLPHARRR